MPRAPRLCINHKTCRNTARGGPYCPSCRPEPFAGAKERWRARRPSNWNTLRRKVLRRDKACTWDGCDQPSVEVDHVVPVAVGGGWDLDNLQGLCAPHHHQKTLQDAAEGRRRAGSKKKILSQRASQRL